MKQLLLIAPMVVFCMSCSDEQHVMERFQECLEMVKNEATQAQSLACWSTDSRAVISGVLQQRKRSASTLDYLEAYQRLLDHKEIESLEVYGDLALMRVSKGRVSQEIVFLKENGTWTINALELRNFWNPLDDMARAE